MELRTIEHKTKSLICQMSYENLYLMLVQKNTMSTDKYLNDIVINCFLELLMQNCENLFDFFDPIFILSPDLLKLKSDSNLFKYVSKFLRSWHFIKDNFFANLQKYALDIGGVQKKWRILSFKPSVQHQNSSRKVGWDGKFAKWKRIF